MNMNLSMKRILTFLSVFVLGLGLALQPVEAKRLGGGANSGQQKQGFAREAAPPSATPARSNTQQSAAQAAPSGASKWLGPLAGLAAGGLLAAMFFGGAFEGLQPLDFLLIALLAFGAFILLRAMRRKQAPTEQAQGYQYAGANPSAQPASVTENMPTGSGYSVTRNPLHDAPAWFNEDQFVQGARSHFLTLQMAWDENNLDTLREYFTDTMFATQRAQRAELGAAPNLTDVQTLHAQLLDVSREGDTVTASVLFQGRIRENDAAAEDFAEIWHVQHAADTASGNWLISGIQQANALK